jgi:hypothetical protein
MSDFKNLIETGSLEAKRKNLSSKNQMLAAQDVSRVQARYTDDIKKGVAVQSAEVARVLKGESGLDGLLKRFESASGLSRSEIRKRGQNYIGASSYTAVTAATVGGTQDKANDLIVVVNLYNSGTQNRVGYNVVDLLDNIYTQIKKKHRVPGVPSYANLEQGIEEYLNKADVDPSSGPFSSYGSDTKLFTSSNVKDIRDFAKKALLPYVTAFFRAFELSDEMIHAAIDAKTDTNTENPLKSDVLPVDTRTMFNFAMNEGAILPALDLIARGAGHDSPVSVVAKMLGGYMAGGKKRRSSKKRSSSKKHGGATQEGGKKRRSSKKRSSGRKMRGGDQQMEQAMEGGKKRRSSKKRSSSKKHGGAQDGGKKKRSSKKRSSGKRRGGSWEQEGGKKKRSSKKRSSSKRRGGAKRRSSKKRSSGRKH